MIVGHNNLHAPVGLVDDDLGYNGRGKSIHHEFGRVHVPRNDVDFFAAQLLNYVLNPGSLHPNAGAYRIDVRIFRDDRDFRPGPRLPRRTDDAYNAFAYLRHFRMEKLNQKVRMGPAQNDLGALADLFHIQDIRPYAVSLPKHLSGDLLLLRQDGFGLTDIHQNGAFVHSLDNAVYNLTLAAPELVIDYFPLGILHLLDDDLLSGLRRNPAQRLRIHPDAQFVPDLALAVQFQSLCEKHLLVRVDYLFDHLLELECLDLPVFLIKGNIQIQLGTVFLPDGRFDGLFKSVNQGLAVNAFFSADLLDQPLEFAGHK